MSLPAVTLEPLRAGDVCTLAAWLADPRLAALTAPDWAPAATAERIRCDYFDRPTGADLLKATSAGRMVGHIGLRVQNGTSGHLFHVIADPALHGRGYGSAMLAALGRAAFERMGLHRLQLFVFVDNVPAIACYMRAGYQIEGRHRDHFRCGDAWMDTYSMALLGHEWRDRG